MDSSIPPPPSRSALRQRPWYLVVTMMVTWLSGVAGLLTGLRIISFLRAGRIPATNFKGMESAALELLVSVLAHAKITFPLAVAYALLSGLLVVSSGVAMSGRRGGRSLALQAVLANAALAILAYALTPFARAAYAEGVARAALELPRPASGEEAAVMGVASWWVWRLKLIFIDLGPLVLAAFALTRARTKAFFDAMGRAADGAEEP